MGLEYTSQTRVSLEHPKRLTLRLSGLSIQGRIRVCRHPAQRGAPEFRQPEISSR